MIRGVTIENGVYGLRAVLTSAWNKHVCDYLKNMTVSEMELNHAKGWHGDSLDFLSMFPSLSLLKIIDLNIDSVHPIHNLHKLRVLEVITYCKTAIRFDEFPNLEECSVEWRSRSTSLFDCVTLKHLFVNRYTGRDVNPFGQLINLESLAILNSPVENLRGLSGLRNLRSLRLGNLRNLTSLVGVEGLVCLEELEINTCRAIGSLAGIEHLLNLRKLCINNGGDLESLRPLNRLTALESVLFYESTNIVDGDLSPLTKLSKLICVSFKNRRHYSHRREDFFEIVEQNLAVTKALK